MVEPPHTGAEPSAELGRIVVRSFDDLHSLRELARLAGATVGFDEARLYDLQVASVEAAANGVEHGAEPRPTEVVFICGQDGLAVTVRSPGAFQCAIARRSERHHRGLGLPLMATLADELSIRQEEESCLVTLFFRSSR